MLIDHIKQFCLSNPAATYWVGYSGGLDSHVLLSLFATVRDIIPINVRAIHINHGLSKNAAAWSLHCAAICQALKVDLVTRSVSVCTENGESLEEQAREQRYNVFADCLQAGDMLVTAHHQDDQAETLLVQLLRGAGVKGLAAMPAIKQFASAQQARPLLSFSREQLLQYANEQQLSWIEDESNLNKKFMRNFVRHDVLPLLNEREPAAIKLLARSAAHCAEAQTLLDEYAAADAAQCVGSREQTLSVRALLLLSPARQRLVLRHWISALGYRLPDHRRLESILCDVLTAAWDRTPCVCWGEVALRRYGDDLFVMHRDAVTRSTVALADMPHTVVVKFRAGGEVVRIPGRGAQSLKNLFQEWRVPPWERDHIPLLYVGDELIAVAGYFLHPDYTYLQLPLL